MIRLTFKLSLTDQILLPLLIYDMLTQLINLWLCLLYNLQLILFLFLQGFTCLLGSPHLLEVVQSRNRSVLIQNGFELCWLLLIFYFKLELWLWLRLVWTLNFFIINVLAFIINKFISNLWTFLVFYIRSRWVIICSVWMELLIWMLVLILDVFDFSLILILGITILKCFLEILIIFIRAETKLKCILTNNWCVDYFHVIFVLLKIRVLILNI